MKVNYARINLTTKEPKMTRYILRELFSGKIRGSFKGLTKAMQAGSKFSYSIKEIVK